MKIPILLSLIQLLVGGDVAAGIPNIVLIYADDMGWEGPSCYGNAYHETPNIDQLAKDGLRFTNAYSGAPVCAPSRAVLLSGQYVGRHGIYRINQVDDKHPEARKTVPPTNLMELPLEIRTIADSLGAAGYETGYAGKWHLGFDPEYLPGERGFDEHITTRSPSGDERYFFPDFSTIPEREYPKGTYMTDVVTEFAVEFLNKERDKPFFLYLPYFNVHGPLEAKPETIDYFRKKDPEKSKLEATYAAMHAHLDEAVGVIRTTLEAQGVTGETLVVFTSDNGMNSKFLLSLRGGKGTLYEAGVRVPLVMSWPGVIKPGSVSDLPVHQVDFYPTFVEVASADLPEGQVLDGESLRPLLGGNPSKSLRKRALFWHYPTYMKYSGKRGSYDVTPCSAIREGKWKLVNYFTSDREADKQLELYDLGKDPAEKKNLVAKYPEVADRLFGKLDRWRVETSAPMPVESRASEGAGAIPGGSER